MTKSKRSKGRPGRNPTLAQAKLKEQIDSLAAPTEQLKQMIVEQQLTNQQLHVVNKRLTDTVSSMLGEIHERLSALETAQFGEVRGDIGKYLAKEDADVQLSEVREDDPSETTAAENSGDADGGGQSDSPAEVGDSEGDTTLH